MSVSSLTSRKHLSRTARGWGYALHPLAHGDIIYFNDADYGGDKLRSLAAALIYRFKIELMHTQIEEPVPALSLSPKKSSETGFTGIIRSENSSGTYYQINLGSIQGISVLTASFTTFGSQLAFYLAVSVRHIYCSYLYGEEYHKHRNKPDTNYLTDQELEELGIEPRPQIPVYKKTEEKEEKSEKPKNTPDKPPRLQISSYHIKETYPDTDIPKTHGIYYFGRNKTPGFLCYFHKEHIPQHSWHAANSIEQAFADALRARHSYLAATYGEEYHQMRNNPENNLPDDKLLKKYGIDHDEASD